MLGTVTGMNPDEQAAPEADDSETTGRPAQTVRVPNVSPGAKSGLDHHVIGSDALAPPEDDDTAVIELEVPEGDVDSQVAWVEAAEDRETADDRATAVYAKALEDGTSAEDLDVLGDRLRRAVYGDQSAGAADPLSGSGTQQDGQPVPVVVPDGLAGEELEAWVSGDAVQDDETNNPERWAAYLARKQAAAGSDSGSGD